MISWIVCCAWSLTFSAILGIVPLFLMRPLTVFAIDPIGLMVSNIYIFVSKVVVCNICNVTTPNMVYILIFQKYCSPSHRPVILTDLNEDTLSFFKIQNFSKAQQFLESYLETNGIECSVPTAVANLWYRRCILWTNPLTPSELAAFCRKIWYLTTHCTKAPC